MKTVRLLTVLILLSVVGCSKPAPIKTIPLTEAHKNFVKLCKEDYLLDVKIKAFNNTLWVYVPLEKNFLQFKADTKGAFLSKKSGEVHSIRYIDGEFKDKTFQIEYDITKSKVYEKGMGTTYKYSQEFQKANQNVISAVNRAYSPVEDPTNEQQTDTPPDFIVIVFADITNGIKIKTLAHFPDIKRALVDPSFTEEYSRRSITRQPEGDQELIGDKDGDSLKYKDYTWEEFLTEQIVYRIEYKYQRSAFPPSEYTDKEIFTIIAEVTNTYGFAGYEKIVLNDLGTDKTYSVNKPELADNILTDKDRPGKFHTIKFDEFGRMK